jgi:hypothetical protein
MSGKINAYDCQACGKPTVTIDVDDGVTPFMIGCRVTGGCRGFAQSRFYQNVAGLTPTYEWYKPAAKKVSRLSRDMQDHVANGGLLIQARALGGGA